MSAQLPSGTRHQPTVDLGIFRCFSLRCCSCFLFQHEVPQVEDHTWRDDGIKQLQFSSHGGMSRAKHKSEFIYHAALTRWATSVAERWRRSPSYVVRHTMCDSAALSPRTILPSMSTYVACVGHDVVMTRDDRGFQH